MSDNCPDDIELHRPYIDNVTITCPHCGKQMKRVPEVIDCWFDSGAMPFAQHHYPFENKELFESQFPAQFISEAVDQTRGWFYSLLAESTPVSYTHLDVYKRQVEHLAGEHVGGADAAGDHGGSGAVDSGVRTCLLYTSGR